jgi:hypothetical protein
MELLSLPLICSQGSWLTQKEDQKESQQGRPSFTPHPIPSVVPRPTENLSTSISCLVHLLFKVNSHSEKQFTPFSGWACWNVLFDCWAINHNSPWLFAGTYVQDWKPLLSFSELWIQALAREKWLVFPELPTLRDWALYPLIFLCLWSNVEWLLWSCSSCGGVVYPGRASKFSTRFPTSTVYCGALSQISLSVTVAIHWYIEVLHGI